ncbi:hypothetical protein SLA2020_281610 [Shorea laevis]
MESVTIKRLHGMAKVLGSVLSVSGALVFAFVKGPPLKFMHRHPENAKLIIGTGFLQRGMDKRLSYHALCQHCLVFVAYFAGSHNQTISSKTTANDSAMLP